MKRILIMFILYTFINVNSFAGVVHGLELSIFNQASFKSFGYNYFNNERGFEIAVPVVIGTHTINGTVIHKNVSVTVDLHFRKHRVIKNSSSAKSYSYWYYGAVTRYLNLSGNLASNVEPTIRDSTFTRTTETRIGLGLSVGYKNFIYSSHFKKAKFYWGFSISYGEYLTGKSNVDFENTIGGPGFDDSTDFFDIEFTKFGYLF